MWQNFAAALSRSEDAADDMDHSTAELMRAVKLYTGQLLPQLYDEWLIIEREQFHLRFQHALERLITLTESTRNYRDAIVYAEQLLQSDALCEETYRTLMRLHALSNDRASALQVYRECVIALQQELETAPSAVTQALYQRLLGATDLEATVVSTEPDQTR